MDAERPRRILMTTDTVGGVWHYSLELSRSLAAKGVDVALATMGAPLTSAQRAQAGKLRNAQLFESAYRLEWMVDPWDDVARARSWLLELEQAVQPEVVHLNQFAFGDLPFVAPKLLVAHSCVLSWWRAVHGRAAPGNWRRYRSAVGRGLAGASLVAAPTRAMLRTLSHNYGYRRRGLVIPNARDARDYRPSAKKPVIFAAGRMWDTAKNLVALEAVAPEVPWPVRVAGATAQPDGGTIEAQHVELLGELPSAELASELGSAAIFTHPARYEPFGLCVLEAALSGCALVLGDIPTLREVWGNAALYVPPDDRDALREALQRLIGDERLRASLAKTARARAMTYTPQRTADAYLAAYSALRRRGRRAGDEYRAFPEEARACAS